MDELAGFALMVGLLLLSLAADRLPPGCWVARAMDDLAGPPEGDDRG